MMPTQLTVLTSASASALKMSPVLNSIMSSPLVVPVSFDLDQRAMCRALHGIRNRLNVCLRIRTDAFHEMPREGVFDQKFRLLSFFTAPCPLVCLDGVPVDFAQACDVRPDSK